MWVFEIQYPHMTTQEKLKAIIERVKILGEDYTSEYISVMVITSYLSDLSKRGLVMSGYTVTPFGENVVAVCEEFDWKPTDADIEMFVTEMVAAEDRSVIESFIRQYRDDRGSLLEKIKRFKDSMGE